MTKLDLLRQIKTKTAFSSQICEEALNLLLEEIILALYRDERVEIRGLGIFFNKNYKGYEGRNPRTGKSVKVLPKKAPFFKCGKELSQKANISSPPSTVSSIV